RDKAAQMVTFSQGAGPLSLSDRGIVEMRFAPQSDGRTFILAGEFLSRVPAGIVGEGEILSHGGDVTISLVKGPVAQLSPGLFRLIPDRSGLASRNWDAWFIAESPGDQRHCPAVQAGLISLAGRNTAGKPQTITFPPI